MGGLTTLLDQTEVDRYVWMHYCIWFLVCIMTICLTLIKNSLLWLHKRQSDLVIVFHFFSLALVGFM